jgi:hypothetical protein
MGHDGLIKGLSFANIGYLSFVNILLLFFFIILCVFIPKVYLQTAPNTGFYRRANKKRLSHLTAIA